MKKSFLYILIIFLMLISCEAPKEVVLPDKHLNIQGKIIMYRNKPYTGKLIILKSDKGNEGYINIKDGYLNGVTEIKNEKDNFLLHYNISNKNFQGDYIYKSGDGELSLKIDKGKVLSMKLINKNENTKYDFTFKDSLANGIFENKDKKIEFKDGTAKFENEENIKMETKFSINQTTWVITMEDFIDGESYSKYEAGLGLDIKVIEQILLDTIKKENIKK